MYNQSESAACFDPNNNPDDQPASAAIAAAAAINGFSSYETKTKTITTILQESDFQNPNNNLCNHSHYDPNTTWDHNSEMGFTNFVENIHHHTTTTDLLTLLHLPISSFASASSSSPPPPSAFGLLGEFNPAMMVDYPVHGAGSGSSYDPNLFPQNSAFMMRDQILFHPNHVFSTVNVNGIDGVYQEDDTQFLRNGILEFRKGKGKMGNNNNSNNKSP
ncbi:uncharacterized protein LOC110692454 [Chenopodium quinoa]|uniref:uncharacterized protein LOC110692454 n=1 Tax=Chenopodium quinoa TaxID=63459 RepID=UPI000B798B3B|nr:uncharacterized protein LOC110692454 [Chenopodium quinoa]